ncbi:Histone-lysine N-methyltransferase SUV39H1-A [Aphelenchoides bicaudatus]|nr:Histone-lysine N-methyltransferase SUV39H1-A [Aphelenchoides bicaudatus]
MKRARVFNQLDNISSNNRPLKRVQASASPSSSSFRTEPDLVYVSSDSDEEIEVIGMVSSATRSNTARKKTSNVKFGFLNNSMTDDQFSRGSISLNLVGARKEIRGIETRPTISTDTLQTNEEYNPGPVDSDDEIYEVDKIVAHTKNGQERYLVKWKGWSYVDCTWEPKNALTCPEVLHYFKIRLRVAEKIHTMCKEFERINYPYDPKQPPKRIATLLALSVWEDQLSAVCRQAGIAPIFVENWIDHEVAPDNFEFGQGNRFDKSAKKLLKHMKIEFKCACNGRTYCERGKCCPNRSKFKFPYYRNKLVNDNQKIVECFGECKCDINCPSRLVQRGRQIPLVLFKTEKSGWSIRTASYIVQGTFVMAYTGEVIDKNLKRDDERYLYDVDCANIEEVTFSVDSLEYGNEARWVNHSCDPNLKTYGVLIDRYENYETLAFFAVKDIQAGEELTIDYYRNLSKNEVLVDGYECHCGAKKCRKFLMD